MLLCYRLFWAHVTFGLACFSALLLAAFLAFQPCSTGCVPFLILAFSFSLVRICGIHHEGLEPVLPVICDSACLNS